MGALPTRTFKSGNSVALRLPKGLGIEEGVEMSIREEQGRFIVERVSQPKRKFDIAGIWGIGRHLGLEPIAPEDRIFEDRSLLWPEVDPDKPLAPPAP
jgi:antitoxin VapB